MGNCSKCGLPSGRLVMCPTCTQNEMLQRKFDREEYGTETPLFWGLIELVKVAFVVTFGAIYWIVSPPDSDCNRIWFYIKWVIKLTFIISVALYIIGVTVGASQ